MNAVMSLYEAKTHFSAVAERVFSGGEHITVTKHGKPVLRMVPMDDEPTVTKKERVAQSLADLAQLQANGGARLSRAEILALKDEGRKW